MVGPGWKGILKDSFAKLEAMGWQGGVEQIKEKFGGLRMYILEETDGMEEICYEAEMKSLSTCEHCGAPGKRHRGWGWLVTHCHECNAKREGRAPFGHPS